MFSENFKCFRSGVCQGTGAVTKYSFPIMSGTDLHCCLSLSTSISRPFLSFQMETPHISPVLLSLQLPATSTLLPVCKTATVPDTPRHWTPRAFPTEHPAPHFCLVASVTISLLLKLGALTWWVQKTCSISSLLSIDIWVGLLPLLGDYK